MTVVAERAKQMVETKVIRRVRTEAGVRRYKQPIGSIIVNDSLLVGLTDKGTDSRGRSVVEGANGRTYTIGLEKNKSSRGGNHYVLRDEKGKVAHSNLSELEVYVELARRIQDEAGIDTRGPGGLPGASAGRGGGYSANQVEAASGEIAAWGNSMEEFSAQLQDDLYSVSARLADTADAHRDLRVARHELEQLRPKVRKVDKEVGSIMDDTAEGILDAAIRATITEGKLPKRYDADTEAEYAKQVLAGAKANAGKPRPAKLSELHEGMWVRKVDNDGVPKGDWFQIRSLADQSVSGRSKLIRGKYRDGSKADFFQQTAREKFETIADPSDQPAYSPPVLPDPDPVTKRVHQISKGDFVQFGEERGYMQDYMPDKDDYSSAERRKNPVYKLEISDDRAGKVNKRTIKVPKGSVSGQAAAAPEKPAEAQIPADPTQWPMRAVESDYEGYNKFIGKDGNAYYTDVDADGWDLYDANDNIIAESRGKGVDLEGLYAAMEEAVASGSTSDLPSVPAGVQHLKPVVSEYEGYERFDYPNGMPAYIKKGKGNLWDAWDANDTRIRSEKTRDELLRAIDREAGIGQPKKTASPPPATVPEELPKLKRLKEKFAGWKRFKLPDGRIVDVGQATEDDNRFYATGKGGWDDIVADGDSEEEVMRKLNTLIGVEQPVTFSPSNTDVAPKRSTIMGLSEEARKRSLQRVSEATRRAVFGGSPGRGTPGSTNPFPRKGDDPNADYKDPDAQLQDDEAERRRAGGRGSQLDELREARAQANEVNQAMKRGTTNPLTALESNPNTVLRNGKPLTRKDKELLNVDSTANGHTPFRLKSPATINLHDRLSRLTSEDRDAYVAVENRATVNYLNGATPHAAWKEAIQTAENIPVPTHHVQLEGTRDGYGAYVVFRNVPGARGYERVTSFRGDFRGQQAATGRMNQENTRARRAAVRTVPLSGKPNPPASTVDAPAASTAGGDVSSRVLQAYQDAGPSSEGLVSLAVLRDRLNDVPRAELDQTLLQMDRSGVIQLDPDPNRRNISDRAKDAAIPLGGEDMHFVSVKPSVASPEARRAEVVTNARMAIEQLRVSSSNWVRISQVRNRLAEQGYGKAEQDRALKQLADSDDVDFMPESNQKTLTNEDREGAVWVGGMNNHLISINSEPSVSSTPSTGTSIASQAESIDEAGARRLARTDPARFLRVVSYRYFKQGKDHRKKDNERHKDAYDELNRYADMIDRGAGVESVLSSIRIGHAGMMGIGRTMMTIRKVLSEEYGQ
jgi:hypothetical protein